MKSVEPEDKQTINHVSAKRSDRETVLAGVRVVELTVSFVTLLILIAGLAFSFIQTEHIRATVERTKFNALEGDLQQVNRVFIQYPELQKYFLSGADILKTDPNYDRVYAIAVAIAMNMDESTNDLKGDQDLMEPGAWRKYYRFQFGASPILCRILHQDADIYGSRIVAIARNNCSTVPPRPMNPR